MSSEKLEAKPPSLADIIKKLNGNAEAALEVQLPERSEHYYYSNFRDYSEPLKQGLATIQQLLSTCECLVRNHPEAPPDWTDPEEVAKWSSELLDDTVAKLDAALDEQSARVRGRQARQQQAEIPVDDNNDDDVKLCANLPSFGTNQGGEPRSRQPTFDNGRDTPFRPRVDHLKGLTAEPCNPELYKVTPEAPVDYPHPFQATLEALTYVPDQLRAPLLPLKPPPDPRDTPLVWVSNAAELTKMVSELEAVEEMAVDLEHHSLRSYQGFTCLMQISTRDTDYVVDAIAVRDELGAALARVFANPGIVKVLHGANMDVLWLQRDFGLYLVNMFDTGQAARVLELQGFGLGFLLEAICGFKADKRFQLADWRIRPLSPEMMYYARCDTHYLLHVYDTLRLKLAELNQIPPFLQVPLPATNPGGAIGLVLERSRQLCLKKYFKPAFDPTMYLRLRNNWRLSLDAKQVSVFAALLDWRDRVGRQEDEGVEWVLPKFQLISLTRLMPEDIKWTLSVFRRGPQEVARRRINELVATIREAKHNPRPLPTSLPRRNEGGEGGVDDKQEEGNEEEQAMEAEPPVENEAPAGAAEAPAGAAAGSSSGAATSGVVIQRAAPPVLKPRAILPIRTAAKAAAVVMATATSDAAKSAASGPPAMAAAAAKTHSTPEEGLENIVPVVKVAEGGAPLADPSLSLPPKAATKEEEEEGPCGPCDTRGGAAEGAAEGLTMAARTEEMGGADGAPEGSGPSAATGTKHGGLKARVVKPPPIKVSSAMASGIGTAASAVSGPQAGPSTLPLLDPPGGAQTAEGKEATVGAAIDSGAADGSTAQLPTVELAANATSATATAAAAEPQRPAVVAIRRLSIGSGGAGVGAGDVSLLGAFFGGGVRPASTLSVRSQHSAAQAAMATVPALASGDGDDEEGRLAQQRAKRLRTTFRLPFRTTSAALSPGAVEAASGGGAADAAANDQSAGAVTSSEAAAAAKVPKAPANPSATGTDIRAVVEAMQAEGENVEFHIGADGKSSGPVVLGDRSGAAALDSATAARASGEAPAALTIADLSSSDGDGDRDVDDVDNEDDGGAEVDGDVKGRSRAADKGRRGAGGGSKSGNSGARAAAEQRVAGSELGLDMLDYVPLPLSQLTWKRQERKERRRTQSASGTADDAGAAGNGNNAADSGAPAPKRRRFTTEVPAAGNDAGMSSGSDEDSDSDGGHTIGPFAKKRQLKKQGKKQQLKSQASGREEERPGRPFKGRRGEKKVVTGLMADFPRSNISPAAGEYQGRGRRGRGGRGGDRGGRGSSGSSGGRRPAAFNPYDIPDEFLMKGGKRSAVMPRSGNRTFTFK